MIDWEKVNIDDFTFKVEGDAVVESGENIVFPIQVYHQDGTLAFLKSIPIRADFYSQLRKTTDWKEALMNIFKQRVRDELCRRLKKQSVSIEEKLDLINLDRQSI